MISLRTAPQETQHADDCLTIKKSVVCQKLAQVQRAKTVTIGQSSDIANRRRCPERKEFEQT